MPVGLDNRPGCPGGALKKRAKASVRRGVAAGADEMAANATRATASAAAMSWARARRSGELEDL
jgi:hypothetical protein